MNNSIVLYSLFAPISRALHLRKFFRSFGALLCNLSLLLNSFLPYFAAIPAYATDVSPLSYSNSTHKLYFSLDNSSSVSYQLFYKTDTKIDSISGSSLPEYLYLGTCSDNSCLSQNFESAILKTKTDSSFYYYYFTLKNGQLQIVKEGTSSQFDLSDEENNLLENGIVVIPTEIPSPTPEPTTVPQIEQICLEDNQAIINSSASDWNRDDVTGISETTQKVQLGVKYNFPQENKVSVTFKCLPKDESLRTTLKIQQIRTSELNLPDSINNVAEFAYDITTGMTDGTFEYDVTLPKATDQTAEVSYIEKTLEQAKTNISLDEIKSISNLEQQTETVKATGVDHFTIFMVIKSVDETSGSSGVTGVDNVWVSDDIYAEFDNNSDSAEYKFPNLNIQSGATIEGIAILVEGKTSGSDVNISLWNKSSNSYSSTRQADLKSNETTITVGSFSDKWGKTWISSDFGSDFKIKVTPTSATTSKTAKIDQIQVKVFYSATLTPPTFTVNPADTYALTSVSGSWISTSGGSNVNGLGTNEVKWGDSTGYGQSGLRFDGSNAQSFNEGSSFYLGMLTHKNWPIKDPADGANLQIVLDFSSPDIANQTFSFDFDINETSNGWDIDDCADWQITSTPCDDKVTFPNSYSSHSFQIGNKLYTLKIEGFVDAFPNGNIVSQFITEEQKNSSAFLVGSLSSVLVDAPQITLVEKAVNGDDADTAPGPNLYVGDAANFTYVVQNTGNVTMTGVAVTDNRGVVVTCPKTTLTAGESMTCTGSSTVVSGQYTNTAHVHGTYNSIQYTSDNESANYFGVNPPPTTGTLIVKKVVVNTGGGTKTFSNFSFKVNGGTATPFDTDGQNEISLNVGTTYNITETPVTNYKVSFSGDCTNVSVTANQTKTCTITNTYLYCGDGDLTGSEECDDGNDVDTDLCSNSCDVNHQRITFCHATPVETAANGWNTQTIDNDGIEGEAHNTNHGADIIPSFSYYKNGVLKTFGGKNLDTLFFGFTGQQILNNDCKIGATLKVVKIVDNTGGGSSLPTDFQFSLNGGAYTNFGIGGSNKIDLNIGNTYAITENPNADYSVNLNNCSGTISSALTTCTVTNTYIPRCGDGTKYGKEECDDGNTDSGDGCSSTCKIEPGTITFIKDAAPNSSQSFHFTYGTNTYLIGNFDLVDDGNSDNSEKIVFSSIPAGTYSWTESTYSDWDLTDITCNDRNSTWDLKTKTVNVILEAGENVTCTFTNSKLSTITITKDAHPNSDQDFLFTTNSLGSFSLDDDLNATLSNSKTFTVAPGHYEFDESIPSGWEAGDISCSGRGNISNTETHTGGASLDIGYGSIYTCTFNNYKQGSIEGYKYDDSNINGSFDGTSENGINNWQIYLYNDLMSDPIDTTNTDISGKYKFENLTQDDYYVCEEKRDNWVQTQPSTGTVVDGLYCYQLDLNQGQDLTNNNFGNYQKAKITVHKFNDLNSDGQMNGDDYTMNGWTINLSGESQVTTDSGLAAFSQLTPKTYYLSENQKDGWKQTNIWCDVEPGPVCGDGIVNGDEECDDDNRIDNDYCSNTCEINRELTLNRVLGVKTVKATDEEFNGYPVEVNPGQEINCYIGNQLLPPKVSIAKSNNVLGNLSPGDSVTYTIRLTVSDNDVSNFKVTDLLSNGIKYRAGSYHVSVNGSDLGVAEPQYHSPGVWNLGNLNAGDTVVLTYTADISSNQQPGTYKDLAYAFGNAAYDSQVDVLATSESTGRIDENFVGTDVTVVKNTQNTVSAGVEKQENVVGEVLGASTELPSTGANILWLLISVLMSITGLTLLKKSSKKLLTILLFVVFLFSANQVQAISNLSLRVEQPKTPTNLSDVNLNFVALDINNDPINVACFKKSPTDSSFTQFSTETLSAGGNASHCALSSILVSEGTYQFYVTATSSVTVISPTISLDYKTSGPGTPSDYRKEHPNNCDYKIHFKTADDGGKTVKVELYRADVTSFLLDSGSVVSSISVGSNEERDITNSVPDCSKNYYYVLRAFDSAGNGSGTVGDSVTVTTTTTTTTTSSTSTTQGAIPVISTAITSPTPTISIEEPGQILGTKNITPTFFAKYWKLLATLLVIIAIIIYVVLKKRRDRY